MNMRDMRSAWNRHCKEAVSTNPEPICKFCGGDEGLDRVTLICKPCGKKPSLREWMDDHDPYADHPIEALQAGYTLADVVKEWESIYNTPRVAAYYLVKDLALSLEVLREMADDSQRWK